MNKKSACAIALTPIAAGLLALPAFAQQAESPTSPVVVTATRVEQRSFDLPVAIDSIDQAQIQDVAKPEVNISEQLNRVPGTVVQNRDSYAQEQQIIIRGFGARSQFGTRGIKLLADGIPASTPDGQGGPGLFDLSSAKRIEVLRGPFSALYGNHSGGVVQVFTEDGPADPTITGQALGGSWGTWKGGLKFGGTSGPLNYLGSLSRFQTDGYRDHSEARKDQFNGKLGVNFDNGATLMVLINYLNQPDNQDPLGLTADQLRQDRRQAVKDASDYRTGRSLDNLQTGLVYELPINSSNTLRILGYVGERNNLGFIATPFTTQRAITQSGGISELERMYGGFGLRWTNKGSLGAMPYTVSLGGEYDRADEARKGYLNNFGVRQNLKRDEDNTTDSWGSYLQGELNVTEQLSLNAGLRYTHVGFESEDHFICTRGDALCPNATTSTAAGTVNGDDSGSISYSAWTPAAGVLFKLTPSLNIYANAGRSFETPTFIELAYRQNASGPNFSLKPSKSNQYEIGAKAFIGADTRIGVALFKINTSDEIVVESNSGGRSTYQNADTKRTGVELSIDSRLPHGLSVYGALTYIDASFDGSFRTCPQPAPQNAPPCLPGSRVTVADENSVPGVPAFSFYGELSWAYVPWGFSTGVEVRWQGKTYVNDVNTETADEFTVVNLRAGFQQRFGRVRLTEFARVDNVLNEKYIGGVIVNDGNGRYYAPAPTSTLFLGVSASYAF